MSNKTKSYKNLSWQQAKESYSHLARQALNKAVVCAAVMQFEADVSSWKGIHCLSFTQRSANWAGTAGVIEIAFQPSAPRMVIGEWAFAVNGTFWFSLATETWETASGHELKTIFVRIVRERTLSRIFSGVSRVPAR